MSVNDCAEIVRRGDPDRFLSAMAAPPRARDVLFPLYAFNVEVSRAPWVVSEPMLAEIRLQWWRDALDEIRTGQGARRHEVIQPLADILDPAGCETLDAAAAARRWDIAREPFVSVTQLWGHLDATAGGLMWTAARLLGAEDEVPVRALGSAGGLAAWLKAVPELSTRGMAPLPDDSPAGVASLARAGLDRIAPVSKAAKPAALAAWETRAVLRMAAKDPGRVTEGRLGRSEARRKASLIRQSIWG